MATAKKTTAAKKSATATAAAADTNNTNTAATGNTVDFSLLKQIGDATMSEVGFMYVGAEGQALVEAGLIETNPDLQDGEGRIAARITNKGTEAMQTQNNTGAAANTNTNAATAAPAVSGGFKIVTGIACPNAKRGGAGDKKYPFDKLPVGGSFFVAATADFDPIKRLGSTVSSAQQRYAVEVPGETRTARNGETVPKTKPTRRFVMRAVEDGAPWGDEYKGMKGAGIFRIEDAA